MYKHPNGDDSDFIRYLSKCLAIINKERKESYITGDFNHDLLKYDTSSKNSDFLNTMSAAGFLPSILQPTRITEFSSTLIDNIFSNNLEQTSKSGNILISFADHFTPFISVDKNLTRNGLTPLYARNYANFNPESFTDDVSIQNWNYHNLEDTNAKFNDFLWRLEGCVDRHAPITKLNKKQANKISKPWITNDILKLIRHRDSLLHTQKKIPLI